jgi:hypothetical protein
VCVPCDFSQWMTLPTNSSIKICFLRDWRRKTYGDGIFFELFAWTRFRLVRLTLAGIAGYGYSVAGSTSGKRTRPSTSSSQYLTQQHLAPFLLLARIVLALVLATFDAAGFAGLEARRSLVFAACAGTATLGHGFG